MILNKNKCFWLISLILFNITSVPKKGQILPLLILSVSHILWIYLLLTTENKILLKSIHLHHFLMLGKNKFIFSKFLHGYKINPRILNPNKYKIFLEILFILVPQYSCLILSITSLKLSRKTNSLMYFIISFYHTLKKTIWILFYRILLLFKLTLRYLNFMLLDSLIMIDSKENLNLINLLIIYHHYF